MSTPAEASNVIPLPRRALDPANPPTDNSGPLAPVGRAVYTVKEVAYLLSLSLGSTYALIRSGDIPARKMGGRWVVPRRRFEEWLNNLPDASNDPAELERDFVREFGPNWRKTDSRPAPTA